jgi:hypothetical protein
MIYVEYISRRPDVTVRDFHAAVSQAQEEWDAGYGEDRLAWSAGRTWRLGPAPEYLTVWHSPGLGFERIDAWDRIFRSGHADEHENVFRRVARIDAAGCYEELREPIPARNGTYYVEFFQPTGDRAAIQTFYAERARRHLAFTLNLLVQRLGKLAPDPGGLAVWTIPSFAALAEIAAELDGIREPIELVQAGTYSDVGAEIL